jgi:hypothetical protein
MAGTGYRRIDLDSHSLGGGVQTQRAVSSTSRGAFRKDRRALQGSALRSSWAYDHTLGGVPLLVEDMHHIVAGCMLDEYREQVNNGGACRDLLEWAPVVHTKHLHDGGAVHPTCTPTRVVVKVASRAQGR